MRLVFKILFNCIITFLVFFIHVAIVNFLPFPFNHIHFILITLIWFIFNEQSNRAITVSVGTALLMELLSSAFFGLQLLSLTITALCLVRIAQKFLTTYSIVTVFFATILTLSMYRLFFLISLTLGNVARHTPQPVFLSLFKDYGIEIAMNVLLLSILYLVQMFLSRRFNPRYVAIRSSMLYDRSRSI